MAGEGLLGGQPIFYTSCLAGKFFPAYGGNYWVGVFFLPSGEIEYLGKKILGVGKLNISRKNFLVGEIEYLKKSFPGCGD